LRSARELIEGGSETFSVSFGIVSFSVDFGTSMDSGVVAWLKLD